MYDDATARANAREADGFGLVGRHVERRRDIRCFAARVPAPCRAFDLRIVRAAPIARHDRHRPADALAQLLQTIDQQRLDDEEIASVFAAKLGRRKVLTEVSHASDSRVTRSVSC